MDKKMCWEIKKCNKPECPAYEKAGDHCWIVAETLCGDVIQGAELEKRKNCIICEVFKQYTIEERGRLRHKYKKQ